MRYFTLIICLFIQSIVQGQQSFHVPEEMDFAGMKLKLTEPVRRSLKADVELITKNQKFFQVKIDRADIYFPMVGKIFRDLGFPDDFKYLALQESSLIADAVSSSNAVGYWQFKKETAQEVGLRVDHMVDERMNIAMSTRGAATYLKKNNLFLNNWIYALLSYNLGLGGVKPHVKDKYRGASVMVIDENMHWYVIRFLAHKLAYENMVGKSPLIKLEEEKSSAGKSLADFAYEKKIDAELLKYYNKWLLAEVSPVDRAYSFILPMDSLRKGSLVVPGTNIKVKQNNHEVKIKTEAHAKAKNYQDITSAKTELEKLGRDVSMFVRINKVMAILAMPGDDISKLALRAGIKTGSFLQYNDLRKFDQIIPGRFYYLQPKKNKALVLKHTVQAGEDIAAVSQKYAIRQSAIRKKNRMDKRESLVPGRVLWLRMKRPKNCEIEMAPLPEVKITSPDKKLIKAQPDTVSRKSVSASGSSGKIHIVKSGETLYSISKMYNVPGDSLKEWNRIQDSSLKPGQELIILPEASKDIIHKVTSGETMYKISRMYAVSVADIKLWNGKKDESLETGEILIIKKK
jgi:membrane-bound lytic murein transglycosylase D